MPSISDLKETSLYVESVEAAARFYRDVLGFSILVQDERLCALDVNGRHVLLLFLRGVTNETMIYPGGEIPPHGGEGSIHAGFSIDPNEFEAWERHLITHGIEVLSRMDWPRGGRSLYLRDPDGHLLELLTPGVWTTF